MAQDRLLKIKCDDTGHIRYTRKKKKADKPEKLKLRKYNPKLRKYTTYTEMKK